MTTPAPTGALPGLRDIVPPPGAPFWPPAPGWIALAGFVVLVLLVLAFREWRFRRTVAYQALKAFEAGARAVPPDDVLALAAMASGVLRRLAGTQDAALVVRTGTQWGAFLQSGKAGFAPDVAAFLSRAPYLPSDTPAPGMDAAQLSAAVRRWIRARA